jgi:hypothetical protein
MLDTPTKPQPRWLRFGLRTLLLLTAFIAAICTLIYEARRQGVVVAALRQRGQCGTTTYRIDDRSLNLLERIRTWLGEEFEHDLDQLWVTQLADDDFAAVEQLPQRTKIGVSHENPTDADLERLGRLPRLRLLSLKGELVTDSALAYIQNLTALETLDLSDTHVTDAGLVYLSHLPHLKELDLTGAEVTDLGLERLRGLTNLTRLELRGTKVTDAGLQFLSEMKQLASLSLGLRFPAPVSTRLRH